MKNINKMKSIKLILLFLVVSVSLQSQDTLQVDNAIAIALQKNFDIRLTENKRRLAENNKSLYNSGYLPTLSASGNSAYANSNSLTIAQNDMENEIAGANSLSYGASIGVNYMLFGGFSRKNRNDQLKALYDLADVQKKDLMNTTILNVYSAYYAIAQLSLNQDLIAETFEISKQRLQKAKMQYAYSQASQLDVLNAEVDANNDSLKLLNIRIQLETAKRNLNLLLGREIEQKFVVKRDVEPDLQLNFDEIKQALQSNNFQLQQLQINKEISTYQLKMSKSAWYPVLSTSASYSLNNALYDDLGMYARQDRNGLNLGLNLKWNIFDGGATKVNVQNAKINMESQSIAQEQLMMALDLQLSNLWAEYSNQLQNISFEKQNLRVAEENFLKTQERYNLGQVNSILFRQAQLNFLNSRVRLINARFAAKIAGLKLKKLKGELIVQ
jgi:outer membrane protein TolC